MVYTGVARSILLPPRDTSKAGRSTEPCSLPETGEMPKPLAGLWGPVLWDASRQPLPLLGAEIGSQVQYTQPVPIPAMPAGKKLFLRGCSRPGWGEPGAVPNCYRPHVSLGEGGAGGAVGQSGLVGAK